MNNLIKGLIAATFLVAAMPTQAAICPDPIVTGLGTITLNTTPDSTCVATGAGSVDLTSVSSSLLLLDKVDALGNHEAGNPFDDVLSVIESPAGSGQGTFSVAATPGYDNWHLVIKDGDLDSASGSIFQWGAFALGALTGSWSILDPDGKPKGLSGVELWGSRTVVPVPAAVWLFGTALLGFVGISRRTSIRS